MIDGLLKGIGVSEGISIGRAWIIESPWDEVVLLPLTGGDTKKELKRYKNAISEVESQLSDCRDRVKIEIGVDESRIFDAHITILRDPFFQEEIPATLLKSKKNPEFLLKEGLDRLRVSFMQMENEYFRQRINDIQDVATRILRVLLQSEEIKFQIDEPAILIAHDLTPSDTARVDREKVLGFVTEMGGKTSHVSLLARSMQIPAVVGVEKLLKNVINGEMIVVDGNMGFVYVDPPDRIIKSYRQQQNELSVYMKQLVNDIDLPTETADGEKIKLRANVSNIADVSLSTQYHADGIGLFRTELPFLVAGKLLSEEEQFVLYNSIAESMTEHTITIRTLDLGGDKFLPFQAINEENNPFLGWRSIRIFLQEKDVFKAQMRAILRTSVHGNIQVLFPMISSLEEIQELKELLEETKAEMRASKLQFDENIKLGIMVEVPSAAIIIESLLSHVDFISIGTNDLIQYTLAADRNNEKVAKFYQPLNPAILSLIRHVIHTANRMKKPVSVCGEMASNPLYTALLLGLGLRQFSMSPVVLPEVKERIRAITIMEAKTVANAVMKMNSADEIEDYLIQFNQPINKRQNVPYLEKEQTTA